MLTTAPVLAMPIDDATYYLDTDCSDVGAGAILGQMQDGKVKVIEYASRTLNKAERSYCATRKEMLALIFGLKHFRSYHRSSFRMWSRPHGSDILQGRSGACGTTG